VDVVLAAAHITTAVQSIVSRNVRAIDSAVISLCAVQAGDLGAFSVMPGTATLVGTVRTFDPAVQDRVEQRLQELCSAVALGLGATAKVNYERIYPATINPHGGRLCCRCGPGAGGRGEPGPAAGAQHGREDFSFMLQHKPGAYLRLGQSTGAQPGAAAQQPV
jgi:hippurate hydrolase